MLLNTVGIYMGSATRRNRCIECQRLGNSDVLVAYGDVFVCMECKEAFLDKLKQGAQIGRPLPGSGQGPWRLGKDMLVFERSADFPRRCLKCGDPADYVLSQTLTLPHLSRMLKRGSGSVTVSLPCCRQHARQIQKTKSVLFVATLLAVTVVSAITTLFLGFGNVTVVLILFSLPFFLILNSMFPKTLLTAQAIEEDFVFATGAGWGFLLRLPQWPETK